MSFLEKSHISAQESVSPAKVGIQYPNLLATCWILAFAGTTVLPV